MFKSLTGYFYERRAGFVRTAGVLGGAYLVGRYVLDRLEDVRSRVVQERLARENVRKRFQQNMQDISFMIMTHMPILGQHVLTEMEVEALTAELQSLSKASKIYPSQPRPLPPSPPVPSSESSMTSSIELVRDGDASSDVRSESGSASASEQAVLVEAAPSRLTESQTSWVDDFAARPESAHDVQSSRQSQSNTESVDGANLSDSLMTASSSALSSTGESGSTSASGVLDPTTSQMSLSTKTKSQLWREVKMLTVTRTLTVMYSTALLSLFTHIQLSLLGRYKYVHSVVELSQDEDAQDFEASLASLFFTPPADQDMEALWDEKHEWEEDSIWRDGVDEETERKYLTLSWWILNIGWKDVAERVRRGVEEVFEGVSLKNKIGVVEFHRLICDVRRRVEHEITFDGSERRINFLSTLLPPTSSALSHLLTRAGFPSQPYHPQHLNLPASDTQGPAFTVLLEETRDLLSSPDFMLVLERCLDSGTEILLDGLKKNVFVGEEDESGEVKMRLAGMLPGLARWSALALNGLPNELVDGFANIREVAALSAIIYSGYEDRFR